MHGLWNVTTTFIVILVHALPPSAGFHLLPPRSFPCFFLQDIFKFFLRDIWPSIECVRVRYKFVSTASLERADEIFTSGLLRIPFSLHVKTFARFGEHLQATERESKKKKEKKTFAMSWRKTHLARPDAKMKRISTVIALWCTSAARFLYMPSGIPPIIVWLNYDHFDCICYDMLLPSDANLTTEFTGATTVFVLLFIDITRNRQISRALESDQNCSLHSAEELSRQLHIPRDRCQYRMSSKFEKTPKNVFLVVTYTM